MARGSKINPERSCARWKKRGRRRDRGVRLELGTTKKDNVSWRKRRKGGRTRITAKQSERGGSKLMT